MIWREKRILLIVLGVLLAANTIFFFTYRVQYQSRLTDLDERLAEAQKQLDEARGARMRTEQAYRSYKQIEADVRRIYDGYWATQAERLAAMIAEVKRLTVASSLVPASISFSSTEVKVDSGPPGTTTSRRRGDPIGATEVGIEFGVEGTYPHVRRLINLLELSDQFVIIKQIGLSAREGDRLLLNLHLKTLFRDDETRGAGSNRL